MLSPIHAQPEKIPNADDYYLKTSIRKALDKTKAKPSLLIGDPSFFPFRQ
jgi:hypothetical protein